MTLEENREYVRGLWRKACEHDHIDPTAMFVLLSDDNPFWEEYDREIGRLMQIKKAMDFMKNSVPL